MLVLFLLRFWSVKLSYCLDWEVFSLCLDESFLIQASLDHVLGREVTLFICIVFSGRLERILKAQKQGF